MIRKHQEAPRKQKDYITLGKNRITVGKNRIRAGNTWCLLVILVTISLFIFMFSSLVDGDSVPYPVLGQVTSCDNTSSFVGANVTVLDPVTGVVRYDTVSGDGIFLVTFGNFMGPDEWYHGDPLMVWVNGTGDYDKWQGHCVTQFDKNRAPPHQVKITMCSSTERIPSPPENLHASLGFTNTLYWIELRWDRPSEIENDAMITYHIYRGTTPQEKIYLGSTTGSRIFNDTYLPFNTTYYYVITAENTAGESLPSPLLNVTTRLSPTAHFSIYPHNPRPNESILFVDSSLDPDGSITNWTWQFTPGGIRYGKQVTMVFPHPGTYTVTLTVLDTTGDQDTTTRTLSLSNPGGNIPGFVVTALFLSLTGAIFLYKKRIQN